MIVNNGFAFYKLLTNLHDVVLKVKLNGEVVGIQVESQALNDTAHKGIIGKKLDEFLPGGFSDALMSRLKSSCVGGCIEKLEFDFKIQDKRRFYEVWISGYGTEKAQLVFNDVSRYKNAEILCEKFDRELKQASDVIKRTSLIDPVAGVLNRKGIEYMLAGEVNRIKRYFTHASAILLLVENYREISDKYGKKTLDVVIGEVASILKKNLRESDVVARVNPRSFAIILPSIHITDAIKVRAKLTKLVMNTGIKVSDSKKVLISLSSGISKITEGQKSFNNFIDKLVSSVVKTKQAEEIEGT